MARTLLNVKRVTKSFGGLMAVKDVSFHLMEGEIVSVIGPNGAGKTTLFNCITGMYTTTSGEVWLHHLVQPINITGWSVHQIARHGVARTFQNIRLFLQMTALENVMAGRFMKTTSGLFQGLWGTAASRVEDRQSAEHAHQLLAFMGIAHCANDLAAHLSYGDRRRVEIARAMATEPSILLLDEPAAGMNPRETSDLIGLIGRIRQQGISIILIEHDMKVVMGISDRVVVLNHGENIAEGTPEAIQHHPRVIEAYLGEEHQTVEKKKEKLENRVP